MTPITVSVTPANATVPAGGQLQFAATVGGSTNTAVTWSVNGGGNISASGLFTAPNAAATVTVLATSAADTSRSGSATVTVSAPTPGVAEILSQPAPATVLVGSSATFQVVAAGSALQYQWRRDGQDIAGGTSAVYTTPATTLGDDGALLEEQRYDVDRGRLANVVDVAFVGHAECQNLRALERLAALVEQINDLADDERRRLVGGVEHVLEARPISRLQRKRAEPMRAHHRGNTGLDPEVCAGRRRDQRAVTTRLPGRLVR